MTQSCPEGASNYNIPANIVFGSICLCLVTILYAYLLTKSLLSKREKKSVSIDEIKLPTTSNEIHNKDNFSTKKSSSYRIEQERSKNSSSEYTRRGMLWATHASWHLPSAPRMTPKVDNFDGLEHIVELIKSYQIDPIRGFLPTQDPLQRLLYARYHLWYDTYCFFSSLLLAPTYFSILTVSNIGKISPTICRSCWERDWVK